MVEILRSQDFQSGVRFLFANGKGFMTVLAADLHTILSLSVQVVLDLSILAKPHHDYNVIQLPWFIIMI